MYIGCKRGCEFDFWILNYEGRAFCYSREQLFLTVEGFSCVKISLSCLLLGSFCLNEWQLHPLGAQAKKLQLTFESVRWSPSFFLQDARRSRYLSVPRWLLLWPSPAISCLACLHGLLTGLLVTLITPASVCSVATWMVLSGLCARPWCPPGPPCFTQAVGLHHLSTLCAILYPPPGPSSCLRGRPWPRTDVFDEIPSLT